MLFVPPRLVSPRLRYLHLDLSDRFDDDMFDVEILPSTLREFHLTGENYHRGFEPHMEWMCQMLDHAENDDLEVFFRGFSLTRIGFRLRNIPG